jgi:hypothetical protein
MYNTSAESADTWLTFRWGMQSKDGKSNARDVIGIFKVCILNASWSVAARTGNIADGTETAVDAVIGCDGIESRVREILYIDVKPAVKLKCSGEHGYRTLILLSSSRKLLEKSLH